MAYSREQVEEYCKHKTKSHPTRGFDHFRRIYETAKKLARDYDDEVLHAAAYLHDLEYDTKDSARNARTLLKEKHGFSEVKLHHVEHAIMHHVLEGKPKTVEAIVLHDANLLDYLGIIGLIRLAIEAREEMGQKDLPSIVKTIKVLRKKIANSFILKQSKDRAAEKLLAMDLAISELEKEIK